MPHIFADDTVNLFYAFGWAQMHAHGDLLLRLYGQARGRAAEYWGERYLESDRLLRTIGTPGRAGEWYAAQSPDFRANLDAFAAGINAYARQHPERLADEVQVVLAVTSEDVLAHTRASGCSSCGPVNKAQTSSRLSSLGSSFRVAPMVGRLPRSARPAGTRSC